MKQTIILLFLYLFSLLSLSAQSVDPDDIMGLGSSPECGYNQNGGILIYLRFNNFDEEYMTPPWDIEVLNIETGDVYDQETYNAVTSFYGLGAGMYSVTLDLSDNCSLSKEIVVERRICQLAGEVRDITCGNNGEIVLSTDCSENGSYRFAWSDGVRGFGLPQSRSGLAVGSYCVTITDEDSECRYQECYAVQQSERSIQIS